MRGLGCCPVDVNVTMRRRVSTRRRIVVRDFGVAILLRGVVGCAYQVVRRRVASVGVACGAMA